MPHRKVVQPPPQDWIDHFDHPPYRLAGVPSEHIPELPQAFARPCRNLALIQQARNGVDVKSLLGTAYPPAVVK